MPYVFILVYMNTGGIRMVVFRLVNTNTGGIKHSNIDVLIGKIYRQ